MEWIGLVVVVLALSWWVVQGETGPGSRGRRAATGPSSSGADQTSAVGSEAQATSEFGTTGDHQPQTSASSGVWPAGEGEPQAAAPDTSGAAATDFATVARESGWFVDPVPQWLVDAAEEWLASNKTSVVPLRNTGEPLDKEEKKALGVNVNAKLGRDYVDALSEAGRAECPLRALETCLERARSRREGKWEPQ